MEGHYYLCVRRNAAIKAIKVFFSLNPNIPFCCSYTLKRVNVNTGSKMMTLCPENQGCHLLKHYLTASEFEIGEK